MRKVEDVYVCESIEEFKMHAPASPGVCIDSPQKRGKRYKYLNGTSTFDIETSNTPEDGLVYSFAFCVFGECVVLRTYEDFYGFLETLVELYEVTPEKRLIIHVHNLGYEAYYLYQGLNDVFHVKRSLFVGTHKVLSIELDCGIIFRDSFRLFQAGLERVTEHCKHPKDVGDLDYTKWRDANTPLDDREFKYIVYDVFGLFEAIENLKKENNYNTANLPLTNTSRVLHAVCKPCEHSKGWQKIRNDLALPRDVLKLAYECMQGGDTHGARWYAGVTLDNCNSVDFKSAHPSQMLTKEYPVGSPLYYGKEITEKELIRIIELGYMFICKIAATDVMIKAGCPNPTISYSKLYFSRSKPDLDNGRILYAEGIEFPADSNDFQRFANSYDYSGLLAFDVYIFQMDYLPEVFRDQIKLYFEQKETLPKDSPEYNFAKICVNSIFGACAQKTVREEYEITTESGLIVDKKSWYAHMEEMKDEEIIKTQTRTGKLPFMWGLWTASCTRLELHKLQKLIGWDKCIYWDTDSIKYRGEKPSSILEYNKAQERLVQERGATVINRNGKPVYIGVAEDEHPGEEYGYRKFRFLHSKCYAYEDKDGITAVIAGVTKKAGKSALNGSVDSLVSGLYIYPAGGQKLWYHPRPLQPDGRASYIYMQDRDVTIGKAESGKFEGETVY